jgi:hypothetical protein
VAGEVWTASLTVSVGLVTFVAGAWLGAKKFAKSGKKSPSGSDRPLD